MQVPNWEIPTSLLKDYLASTQSPDELAILDRVLLKPPLHEVVNDDAFGKFRDTEGVETPIDGVPPLEGVIRRHKHSVLLPCKRHSTNTPTLAPQTNHHPTTWIRWTWRGSAGRP